MVTVAFEEAAWKQVASLLTPGDTELACLLVGTLTGTDKATGAAFVVNHVVAVPDEAYEKRTTNELVIRSSGWVHTARQASKNGFDVAFVHTHPGGRAEFSSKDDVVEDKLSRDLRNITGQQHLVAIVMAGTPDLPRVLVRRTRPDGQRESGGRVRSVGTRLHVMDASNADVAIHAQHDRQIRFLGEDGQRTLQGLRIGLAGLGGNGSELLVRLLQLGATNIVGIDADVVTSSTVTRGSGFLPRHIGLYKAEALNEIVGEFDASGVRLIQGDLGEEATFRHLLTCDVVFGCVDTESPRINLNQLPYRALVPFIDTGIRPQADRTGQGVEVDARVTWLAPGYACLLCRSRIDLETAAAETLTPDERRRRALEGYVPELDEPAPSVNAYTALVGGLALNELFVRLFGFGRDTRISEVIARPVEPRFVAPGHQPACPLCETPTPGRGLGTPLFDTIWGNGR